MSKSPKRIIKSALEPHSAAGSRDIASIRLANGYPADGNIPALAGYELIYNKTTTNDE